MRLVVIASAWAVLAASTLHAQPACSAPAECLTKALEAEARQAFEDFHTLAWRVMQTSTRRNDPAAMALLARAQSLSGRPGDALVMLRRLADMGVAVADAESADAFERVRSLADWPEVLEKMRAATTVASPAPPSPAPSTVRPESDPKESASPAGAVAPDSPARPKAATIAVPGSAPKGAGAKPASADTPAAAAEKVAEAATAARKTAAPAAALSDSLSIPASLVAPIALDYDAVSKRFVVADDASETLKVLDESSGNAVNLVSRGWAGEFRTTALFIDSRRGDLWVAGTQGDTAPRGAVHRVQLVSGRRLYTVEMAEVAAPTRFVDLALHGSDVLALDGIGRRIYAVAPESRTLQLRAAIDVDHDLTSFAPAPNGLVYVAHAGGLSRAYLNRKRVEPIKAAAGVDLHGLRWIRHHQGRLLGIQERDDAPYVLVAIELDPRGTTATAVDVIDRAHAATAALNGNVLYFVGADADAGPRLKRLELR